MECKIAKFAVADRDSALPFSVVWIACGEALSYFKCFLMGFEGTIAIAVCRSDFADAVITERDVALPLCVVRIAYGEALFYLKSVFIGFESGVALASCGADIADLVVTA